MQLPMAIRTGQTLTEPRARVYETCAGRLALDARSPGQPRTAGMVGAVHLAVAVETVLAQQIVIIGAITYRTAAVQQTWVKGSGVALLA